MFIKFACFISVGSFAFVSVIILFDSSAIQIMKKPESEDAEAAGIEE